MRRNLISFIHLSTDKEEGRVPVMPISADSSDRRRFSELAGRRTAEKPGRRPAFSLSQPSILSGGVHQPLTDFF
jgi:hypothetical protein